jgi:hypothetical protein
LVKSLICEFNFCNSNTIDIANAWPKSSIDRFLLVLGVFIAYFKKPAVR